MAYFGRGRIQEFVNVKWQGLKSSDNSWEPLSAFMQNHRQFCKQYDMPHQDEIESLQNNTVFIFNLNYKRKKKCFFYTPDGKVVAAQKVGGRSKSREKSSATSSTEEAPEDTGGLPIEDNLQEDQRVTAFVQLQLDRQGRMKASQVGHLGARAVLGLLSNAYV